MAGASGGVTLIYPGLGSQPVTLSQLEAEEILRWHNGFLTEGTVTTVGVDTISHGHLRLTLGIGIPFGLINYRER